MTLLFINLYCVYLSNKMCFWSLANIKDEKWRIQCAILNVFAAVINAGVAGSKVGGLLGL